MTFPGEGAPVIDSREAELYLWRDRLKALHSAPRLGVDTGGTFTDFVLVHRGTVTTWKEPSRPADPGGPVKEALAGPARGEGPVFIGTTVGTNALLERKGARVALVTTAGFEDLLDLARQTRSSLYDLNPPLSPPLVPRELRYGAGERLGPDGTVDSALDAKRLRDIVGWIGRSGAEAVAVMFLHAWINDVHERMVEAALHEAFPGLPVSLSSRVLPQYREYERLCATVVNASLGPIVARYLAGLGTAERPLGIAVSSGGILPASLGATEPVRTVLSGPAAGVVAAHHLARRLGGGPVLTLDMGGTSTDVAWVDPGRELPLTTSGGVGGTPIALPSVDIVTVGAGGGSIARLDAAGALTVGPESAGARPGPAAYGAGGPATLTDAALVLGLLPAEVPIAGGLRLDRDASVRAVGQLAGGLDSDVELVARAIVDSSLARMERALRKASSARGHDPREARLLAYGGAGGLFAVELARRLGMAGVIVPPAPGVFSAWGTLAAPVRLDYSRSVSIDADQLDGGSPFGPFWNWFGHFVPALPGESGFFCSFGARYPGQSRDIRIAAAAGWEEAFHAEHERQAGHARRNVRPTIGTLSLTMLSRNPEPPLPHAGEPAVAPGPPRLVVFPGAEVQESPGQPDARSAGVLTPVLSRTALLPGRVLSGPAIVVEQGGVTVVPPGVSFGLDDLGALAVRFEG
jgi:N-methylhydantoinase A